MAALTLEALHREARRLESAHRRGDEAAIARVAPFRPDPRKPLKDAGAQMVIAREHGFPSWVRLRAYVERVDAGGQSLEHPFHTDMEYYEGRAEGLLASAQDRTPSAAAAFEGEGAELTPEGAREVVAVRHGFATWAALRRHVEGLAESGGCPGTAGGGPRAGSRFTARSARWRTGDMMISPGCSGSSRSWRRPTG